MSSGSQPSSPLLGHFLSKPSSPSTAKRQDNEVVNIPVPPVVHQQETPGSSSAPSSLHPASPFALPLLPAGRSSTSSLLEAVIGRTEVSSKVSSSSKHGSQTPTLLPGLDTTKRVSPSSPATESWDVLSEISTNVSESREEVVELQKKVDKRKSHLPQLESQLKALEDKIREAEERLAKAQGSPGELSEVVPS